MLNTINKKDDDWGLKWDWAIDQPFKTHLFFLCHVSNCRATAVQSPPNSCSFRALLEEEENRLIRAGQTGVQRGRITQVSPVSPAPVTRRVTFKCTESSESERPTGWVSTVWVAHAHTHTQAHKHRRKVAAAADDFSSVLLFSTGWHCWRAFLLNCC